jgi:hypothetical protein
MQNNDIDTTLLKIETYGFPKKDAISRALPIAKTIGLYY